VVGEDAGATVGEDASANAPQHAHLRGGLGGFWKEAMRTELKQTEVVQQLQSKLKALSSSDLQLWSIGLLIMTVLAAGFAALVLPNMMWRTRQLVVADKYLPQLLFGFIALIVLFNVYVLSQRRELDNSRRNWSQS